MVGLLLGGILVVWSVKQYVKISEDMKIRKRLGFGAQTLMVKILDKENSPRRRRSYYFLDKSVDDLCFKGQITVEGITRQVTVISNPETEVGKVYMMRGWFYPLFELFLPNTEGLYCLGVREGFWIPGLLPKAILMKKIP